MADDFSLADLHAALDAQRRARGLTWAQAAREIGRQVAAVSGRGLSPSTVTGLSTRGNAEADGVLQMLLWLERSPESFARGDRAAAERAARLPDPGAGRVLRFDTARLHAALDARRVERGLTWAQLARELDVGATTLSHLAAGGRTAFPHVLRLTRWLELPAARFTRGFER